MGKTPRLAGCGATSPLFFCIPAGSRLPATAIQPSAEPVTHWVSRPLPGRLGRALENSLSQIAGFKFLPMDGETQAAIHQALSSVQSVVTGMTFPWCDQEDLQRLIDRVEEQLHSSRPNTTLMYTFLNSTPHSLRAQPEARAACLTIEQPIETAGMPSTWQSGI